MKTLIIFNHVAGMCEQVCVNLEKLAAFAPHREMPEELTVIYADGNHFWASIPFTDFVHWMDGILDARRRDAITNGSTVCFTVAPTKPLSEEAELMAERRFNRDFPPQHYWKPGGGKHQPKPRRYNPDSR